MDATATTLILSRHGRTEWSADGRYAGSSEIELDARGREQAARLAGWAAGARLDAIVCSPLVRAVATAEPAARAADLPLRRDERLRELHFGAAEGRRLGELRAEQPEAIAAFEADPAANPLPQGEEPAAEGLRAAARLAPGGRVLVVWHNTITRLALCALLGIPLRDYRRALPLIEHEALAELRLAPAPGAEASGGPLAAPVAGDRLAVATAALLRLNAPLPDRAAEAANVAPGSGIR